ncbi:MAG TPA: hypothetical protein VEL28_13640 [Candidatus Binatia bacterium]|nr:hypothetical protein [Candidatus Binatia bacterium]
MTAASELVQTMALVSCQSAGTDAHRLPTVLTLHDRNGNARHAMGAARTLFGEEPAVLAPQAARPCNPFQSNFEGAPAYAGYSWYLGSDSLMPEPASFGDALCQLELLLGEEALRNRRGVVLHGYGQGAALALALASYGAGNVTGLVVDRCQLPRIAGWTAPSSFAKSLRCLLLGNGSDEELRTRGIICEYAGGGVAPPEWMRSLSTSEDR